MSEIRAALIQAIRANGVRATARLLGKDHATVSRFLKGDRDLTLADLERLERASKVRIRIDIPDRRD